MCHQQTDYFNYTAIIMSLHGSVDAKKNFDVINNWHTGNKVKTGVSPTDTNNKAIFLPMTSMSTIPFTDIDEET